MWHTAPSTSVLFGKEAPKTFYPKKSEVGEGPDVEVRSVCDFYHTTYGGCQSLQRPSVRQLLVQYYKEQFRHIPVENNQKCLNFVKQQQQQGQDEERKRLACEMSANVKKEEEEGRSIGEVTPEYSSLIVKLEGDEETHANCETIKHQEENVDHRLRFRGILTKVHPSSIGEEAVIPWEFHVIHHLGEESEYSSALAALSANNNNNSNNNNKSPFHRGRGDEAPILLDLVSAGEVSGRSSYGNPGMNGASILNSLHREEEDDEEQEHHEPDGRCLALYTKLLTSFTGVYEGMAVGVVGEPCGRSKTGVLTALLVHELVTPLPPVLPWRLPPCGAFSGELSSSAQCTDCDHGGGRVHSSPLSTESMKDASSPISGRVHYCSGPYPRQRQQVMELLYHVLHQALDRGADLLLIGGPFISEAAMTAEDAASLSVNTFSEYIEGYAIFLQEELTQYYSTIESAPHAGRLKVVFLPHRSDVTQVPVLPTVMFSIPDDTYVRMRSSPCRVSMKGVHIGVCNEDVIGRMQMKMVERWPVAQHHLRRVVETIVQSRTYLPIFHFPTPEIDVKYWNRLRLDFMPCDHETGKNHHQGTENDSQDAKGRNSSWNLIEQTVDKYLPTTRLPGDVGEWKNHEYRDKTVDAPPTTKFKMEPIGEEDQKRNMFRVLPSTAGEKYTVPHDAAVAAMREKVEYMPHIMLLPSSRPAFAILTHRSSVYPDHPNVIVPESGIEDSFNTSGILVVNPEVWSTRCPGKYALRVAEISIHNVESVVKSGVSLDNTSSELLHVYSVAEA